VEAVTPCPERDHATSASVVSTLSAPSPG